MHAYSNTYTKLKNESKHSEMDPVRQNPIQRTVRLVHVCALHCAQLLRTILHRTGLIIFPLIPRLHDTAGCTTSLTTGCIHDTAGCQTGLTTG